MLATTNNYLESLNVEQRRTVEHGVGPDGVIGSPLLAGAGSGKTNTLAHRVAHLIIKGAEPRKILLIRFSRRAASEMARRVERIARRVLGDKAGIMTDALTWAGTFHGIGARLLREYAERIDRNYRSTQPVLAAANGVIGLARERFTKNLWTERNSAQLPLLVTVREEAGRELSRRCGSAGINRSTQPSMPSTRKKS